MAGYYPNGQLSQLLYGNGVAFSSTQNTRLLPASYAYSGAGTTLLSESYTYDADGNLTQTTDQLGGNGSQTNTYDGLNRLVQAQAPNAWGTQSYAYDARNDLREIVMSGYPFNLGLDSNDRLVSMTIGSSPFVTYQNDGAGDRSAMTYQGVTTTYRWDARHQLLGVVGKATYAYDEAGRRVEKTLGANGQSTASFYAPDGELMYTVSGGELTKYVYLAGRPAGGAQRGRHDHVPADRPAGHAGARDQPGGYGDGELPLRAVRQRVCWPGRGRSGLYRARA